MKMRIATAIAKLLEQVGTEYVFAYNGHGNWALLDSFKYETKIKGIPTRAEDHAVHMADCYWRMKRCAPMAVVSTSVGPGNMNIASALANAFFESSALLVLAGGGSTSWLDRGGIEEFYRYGPDEFTATLKPISKKAFMVSRPDTAIEMIIRAYKTAILGRPGPVVVQLPYDIQHTEIDVEIPDLTAWLKIYNPGPDPEAIKEAANIIVTSEKPLVVVSSGIHNARAWSELLEFIESFNIPVITAVGGKGAVSEENPFNLGVVGRAGTGHANAAASDCDVLIAIGTHFSDIDSGGWTLYNIPKKTKLIHIDIDPSEINRVYPAEVGIISDARLALRALIDELRSRGYYHPPNSQWLQFLSRKKQAWEEETIPDRSSDLAPLHYARLCEEVWKVIKEVDPLTSIVFDTGHLLSFAPPFLKAVSRFISHNGFFHRMGWSIPGAIGAKLANPEHPSVCLCGDGSFLMTGTAVCTAVEQGIPVTWIVLNNRTLQIERELMTRLYGREAFCDYKIYPEGILWNPDFISMAEAMGAKAIKVSDPKNLNAAVKEGLLSDKPVVIDVDINVNIKGYRAIWYPYPANFFTQ